MPSHSKAGARVTPLLPRKQSSAHSVKSRGDDFSASGVTTGVTCARRARLTVAAIERFKPPGRGRREVWDDVVAGLGLRITENGARSFFWLGRIRGRGQLVRVTLGPYPAVTLAKARVEAREALHMAMRGEDPREPRRKRAKEALQTFESVAKSYVDRYVRRDQKLRTADELEARINRHLVKTWGKRPIGEITRSDVRDLLNELVDDGMGVGANRVFAAARGLFNWALGEDLIAASPCIGVAAPKPENRRERVLAEAEIRAIWQAAGEIPSEIFGRFARMLFATAQRRSEVAGMRWDSIDRERNEWTIASEGYKSKRVHVVPLTPLALEILDDCKPIEDCPYVFSSNGKTPISGFNSAKQQLDEKIGEHTAAGDGAPVEPWIFHDVRRTAASAMTGLGIPRFIVERVLGHADRTLAATYDRYDYLAEKRDALERWGKKLREIVGAKRR